MSLQANITLNVLSVPAGQPAQAMLQVYNPNAVTVVVTGVNVAFRALGDALPGHTSVLPVLVPIGQGQTTSIPALSSVTFPFTVVVPSAAVSNSFQAVNQTGNLNPINPQGTQPSPFTIVVSADVFGSDGSSNAAGTAALIVGPAIPPPTGFQGGFLNQSAPNNFVTFLAVM